MEKKQYCSQTGMIDYFKFLSYHFERDAIQAEDELEKAFNYGKAAAYELAARELEHNLIKGDKNDE